MAKSFVHETSGSSWSLGAAGLDLRVAVGKDGLPRLSRLALKGHDGVNWASDVPVAPFIVVAGTAHTTASGTLRFTGGTVDEQAGELVLGYAVTGGLEAEVRLAPAASNPVWRSRLVLRNEGSKPIEGITRFDAMGLAVAVGDREPLASYVLGWMEGPRVDAPGRPATPWKYGGWIPKFLYGEGYPLPPAPEGGWSSPAYRVMRERLTRLPLRSGKRSTYENQPWVAVLDIERGGGFFAGFEWSGTWRMDVAHDRTRSLVTLEVASDGCTHTLAPNSVLESPPAFAGLFAGDWDDASNASRRYVGDEIIPKTRHAWPTTLHVYYFHNTPELRSDEYMRREVDSATALGFESLYVESPWWSESPLDAPPKDFSLGLGDFQDSRERFPGGLRAMSDYVHAKGMNFGMWFEIERVDVRTCNRLRIPWKPEWIVHRDGYPYRSWCQYAFMLCLGVKAAAEWALQNILWAVKEYGLDYIMFDSNEWAVCTDPTHDHGAGDGEWAQIQGFLYLIRELRRAHPDLMVLNSSGGSQRGDFAIARYSTYIHPHDTQAPSARERRYLYGTGSMYPSGYQAQALGNYAAEPNREGVTAPWLAYAYQGLGPITVDPARFEWRMLNRFLGYFALGHETSAMQHEHREVLRRGLAFYKRIRSTLNADRYVLLPPRVLDDPACLESDNWEAYQHVSRTGDQALLHVYRCLSTEGSCTVRLRGLDPEARYRTESWRGMKPRTAAGRSLMERGFTCELPGPRTADIVILTRQ